MKYLIKYSLFGNIYNDRKPPPYFRISDLEIRNLVLPLIVDETLR